MEVRRGVTILEHSRERGHDVVVYKRDKKNAFGTVDLNGVAFLLSEEGVSLPAALVPEVHEASTIGIHHSGGHHQGMGFRHRRLPG